MSKIQIEHANQTSMDEMKKFKEIIIHYRGVNEPESNTILHYYIENPDEIYIKSHGKKELVEGFTLNRLRGFVKSCLDDYMTIYGIYDDGSLKGYKTAVYGRKGHRDGVTYLENSVRKMF